MQHKSKLSPRQSETVFDDALPESPEKLRDELSTLKISKRRKRNRRRHWSVLLVTGASVMLSLLLMATMFSVHAEYSRWQTRVAQRDAELNALENATTNRRASFSGSAIAAGPSGAFN